MRYRVSQKFVPLISCAVTFDQHFCMKFLKDAYCSLHYLYSEVQHAFFVSFLSHFVKTLQHGVGNAM